MVEKSLDIKLAKLRRDIHCGEFILADARDPDMARGIHALGTTAEPRPNGHRFASLAEFRQRIRDVVHQGLVDIMLMSAHTSAILTIDERLFDDSPVTPAARANDTTDIHVVRSSVYTQAPARPFRTALLDHIQCGFLDGTAADRKRGANLGLYSVTFNNDLALDLQTLDAYREFRIEAERKGFRHFLEVFDPNTADHGIAPEQIGAYVNDMIVRLLAGVPDRARPVFLKMVYHGPRYTEELVEYDPTIIVGILGGSSGTTYDAFKLIAEAQKYGARAALFGRKINAAELPLTFIEMLKRIVDGAITPEEAVRAYHAEMERQKVRPHRPLADDLQLTDPAVSYAAR
jgi:hypothetical protein